MGRKRKRVDQNLPPYVYRGRSCYEYRPYVRGQKRPTIRLCKLTDPLSLVWEQYEKQLRQPTDTLGWLLDQYLASRQFTHMSDRPKSLRTVTEQRRQAAAIKGYPFNAGQPFGNIKRAKITRGIMRRYLDARAFEGSPVSGNREHALISAAWNWALERDLIMEPNPCTGVSRNTERHRTRLVTPAEYTAVYQLAGQRAETSTRNPPAYLQPAMELAYLCRMRKSEILGAKKSDVTPAGFETRRLKGSRDALTEWSDRLVAAVDAAKATPRNIEGIWLLQDKHGQRITVTAFNSAWRRLIARAQKRGIEPFHFHDLKAAGVSDFEGDKQAAGGHRTAAQVRIYDRATLRVKPTR